MKIIVNGKEVQPCKVTKLYKEIGAREVNRLLRSKKKNMGYKKRPE